MAAFKPKPKEYKQKRICISLYLDRAVFLELKKRAWSADISPGLYATQVIAHYLKTSKKGKT